MIDVQASLRRFGATYESRWLALYVAARLAATAFAAVLLVWERGSGPQELLLVYGLVSTALLAWLPALRQSPVAWAVDGTVLIVFILLSGDWRSPFYLLWLSTLALPATALPLRQAAYLAVAAPILFLVVAFVGGPQPGIQVRSAENLAIHVSLPFLLVASLAYAASALRRLNTERAERERLAIEGERRRIAWELHDSAKQRIHAAHLLVSSLQGQVPSRSERTLRSAVVELESAASDMDTSLAELRSPLEGRPLADALRERAAELAPGGRPAISVHGTAPQLSPLALAHVYRIGSEAITNALRHADATTIDVAIENGDGRLRLRVTDDGRGLPDERRSGATGIFAMESRAATIGAQLQVGAGPDGRGTVIDLEVPINENGGSP